MARQFILLFEKCDNATFDGVCKSEEEITDWIRRKFVIVIYNSQKFSSKDYEDSKKVISETVVNWIPINS